MSESMVDRVLGANVDYIEMAVPLFFTLIVIEFACAWIARAKVFRLNDSINDLSCGILDQVLKVFLHGVFLSIYIVVWRNWAFVDVATLSPAWKWSAAFLCFLGVDFCFYWHHRFAHLWAAPWATHVVHHQSEDMNLIVALRQSALEHYLCSFWYLPLALVGFPPTWYVAMFAFNLIWQFVCHTRLIGKLGPIEWVFNTPSHHRVHHGRNLKYLDKNYAGTLIIWDRMFGSFQEEEEEPVYGITRPIKSWNPLWANAHYWIELAHDAYRAPYWWDKVKIWFMPLGWRPRGLEPKPSAADVTPQTQIKYNVRPSKSLMVYAVLHFALILVVGTEVQRLGHLLPLREVAVPASFVVFSLATIGGVLERKRWVPAVECIRLILLAIAIVALRSGGPYGPIEITVALVGALASLVFIVERRGEFTESTGPWIPKDPIPTDASLPQDRSSSPVQARCPLS